MGVSIPFTAATVVQTTDGYDVTWTAPSSAGAVKVFAGTDSSCEGSRNEVGAGASSDTFRVNGLPAVPRWYFELVPAEGRSLIVADRSLHLASAPNFRDVGGYRTVDGRWMKMGLLYRADALDTLADDELATIEALGVQLVCDLRTNTERAKRPDRDIPGATNEHLNIGGGQDELAQTIADAITSGEPAEQQRLFGDGKAQQLMMDGNRSCVSSADAVAGYTTMFERIKQPANLPTLLHCTGGRDRTGWAASTILTMLGVPKATVMQDYLLSNDNLRQKNEEMLTQTAAFIDRSLVQPLLEASTDYLHAGFAEVDAQYGTFDDYVAALGVTKAAQQKLEQQLLAG